MGLFINNIFLQIVVIGQIHDLVTETQNKTPTLTWLILPKFESDVMAIG